MQKTSKFFKRKAAGMMAAVMMMSAIPVNMVGFADTSVNNSDRYAANDRTATDSNASLSTASNALKMQTEGTTYYVDARDGNDTADGKTEDTAWKGEFQNISSRRQNSPEGRLYLEPAAESKRKRSGRGSHNHRYVRGRKPPCD